MNYWYAKCFKQYADFTGRARRREFWFFTLASFIVVFLLNFFGSLLFKSSALLSLYLLVSLLPTLAASVRRLHDTDRSGYWVLLNLLPIIGGLILLFFYCQAGTDGDNRFGQDPLKQPETIAPEGQAEVK